MNEPISLQVICPACGVEVSPEDSTCAACGAMITANEANRAAKQSFVDARWFIICTMVFAALFLGFPLLWRSKAFSVAEKTFWTLAVAIESVVIFTAFGWFMWYWWQTMRELL